MAHAVVIYVYGQVHMRSDRGLPTNITTVLFENLHWDCRPVLFSCLYFILCHFSAYIKLFLQVAVKKIIRLCLTDETL